MNSPASPLSPPSVSFPELQTNPNHRHPHEGEWPAAKKNGVTTDHARHAATKPVLFFLMGTE